MEEEEERLQRRIDDILREYQGAEPQPARDPSFYDNFASTLQDLWSNWDDPEPFLWLLWSAIIRSVVNAPPSRPMTDLGSHVDAEEPTTVSPDDARPLYHFVNLMAALKRHPSPLDSKGQPASCWAGQCWKDLPVFGACVREALDCPPIPHRTTHSGPGRSDADSSRLPIPSNTTAVYRMHLFAALLTREHIHDFSLYAIWALREAFEEATDRLDMDDTPGSTAAAESIRIACMWILVAGDTLYRTGEQDYGQPGRGGSKAGEDVYGFTDARWKIWQEGLRRIAQSETTQGDLSRLADRALSVADNLLRTP